LYLATWCTTAQIARDIEDVALSTMMHADALLAHGTYDHHFGAGDEVGSGQLVDALVPLACIVVEPEFAR
jgi:hypothetical protein